jgi:hypothetical protein
LKYNGDINAFGGIQDYHMIHEALKSYLNDEQDFKERMVKKNEFSIRTEAARGRFYRGIKSSILTFKNEDHKSLYHSFFNQLDDNLPYNFLIFWLLCQNNLLFQKLSNEVYLKFYFNGKISITGDDVFAYLQHLQETDKVFGELKWATQNTKTLASKYLTILRKLDLVEGRQKKQLKHIQISDTTLTIYLFVLKACYPETSNILTSKFLPFSFLTQERFVEKVKKTAQKGWFEMTYTGTNLNIEPIIKYNQLSHALFGRP